MSTAATRPDGQPVPPDRRDAQGTDLAVVNARILCMDAPGRTATALLARGGRVSHVGSDGEILAALGPEEVAVDLGGRTVVPGFIDPHQHFSMAVFEPVQVDCRTPPLTTLSAVLERLAEAVRRLPPGRWVRGWGYHWSRVTEQRSPSRADLDALAPNDPVIVMDASYHGCFVNSAALQLAGIDRHAPPGRAGIIVLDERGDPTGALLEGAMDRPEALSWVDHVERDPELALELVERLGRRHLALGITAVSDALVLPAGARLYRRAADAGRLPLSLDQVFGGRTFFDVPRLHPADAEMLREDGSGPLRGGMVKLFMDVVHPSPAIDRPVRGLPDRHTGVNYYARGELAELVLAAVEQGLGVVLHALGDCAIDQALDACAAARETVPGRDALLRVDHFVLASRDQARRAADLGVVVASNPGFVDTWGDQYLERWSIEGRPELKVLPLRDLLDAGVTVAAASDYPCDALDPFHGIWAAVARRSWTGDELYPDQAVTPLEALRMCTSAAAIACGRAADRGSIEPGKRADLVVLDRDPLRCATEDLASVRVEATYLDGALVHASDRHTARQSERRSPPSC